MKVKLVNAVALSVLLSLFLCSNTPTSTRRISDSIRVDGLLRTYTVHLPSFYHDSSRYPVVIMLHGAGGSALQAQRDYGWDTLADAENFVVVYPEGVKNDGVLGLRTWNAGDCCQYASEHNIPDVKYISLLIDKLASQYRVNTQQVFVAGMSNGAMMAYRLACEIPDKITAVAAVSGPLMFRNCRPSRPVPVMHIHSVHDKKVPYRGGRGLAGYTFKSVDTTLTQWVVLNRCVPMMRVEDHTTYTVQLWDGCTQPVRAWITKDGGHSWPGGRQSRARADQPSAAFDATRLIWNFFKEQTR